MPGKNVRVSAAQRQSKNVHKERKFVSFDVLDVDLCFRVLPVLKEFFWAFNFTLEFAT